MATVRMEGEFEALRAALVRLGTAIGPEGRKTLHEIAGRRMAHTEVPLAFRNSGPGWAPLKYRVGQPLLNTGKLVRSVTYRADASEAVVGSNARQARVQNEGSGYLPGGVIRPVRAKFLAIPLSPPLTGSEARVKRPRDFAGAFVLMKGPEGPGLYRKSGAAGSSSLKDRSRKYGKGRGIERIFAFVKSVKIPARPFLVWKPEHLATITRLWAGEIERAVKG